MPKNPKKPSYSAESWKDAHSAGSPDWQLQSPSLDGLEERARAAAAERGHELFVIYEELPGGEWKKIQEEHIAD